MKFDVVDGCPVPAKIAPVVREAKRRSGQNLTSCFRGSEARAILAANGKKDQATLYWGFAHGLPGYNPANQPGFSTHECFNDGPAFPQFPRGARIPDEFVGQDWTNAWAVVRALREMGLVASLTYPTSVREKQHLNIRKAPRMTRNPLRRGQKGRNVASLVRDLRTCHRPHTSGERYLPLGELDSSRDFFSRQVELAVQSFQRDHGLKPDGVVGVHTLHQIQTSAGFWRRHH